MTTDDRPPGLDELRRELEALGMVAVPFRDEIHIRRSTLEYIKVRIADGVLHCEPCIGIMTQARATWALLVVEMMFLFALRSQPTASPLALGWVFTGILAFGLHALRYTLSEITISRVQSVWLGLRERQRIESQFPAPHSQHRSQASPHPILVPVPGTPPPVPARALAPERAEPLLSEGDPPVPAPQTRKKLKTPI